MSKTYADLAIQAAIAGQLCYCKFLSANDTGKTGGHQAGIYIAKPSIKILFAVPGKKGENKDKWVKVKWQNDFVTNTRFIYYGKGTRNEYRITNFGKSFPFLMPEYTGALFVLIKEDEETYQAFFLNSDEEIESFLSAFMISPTETNCLIDKEKILPEKRTELAIQEFINGLSDDFPTSDVMSVAARNICDKIYNHSEYIYTNPDKKIIEWINMEYSIFRALEYTRYSDFISRGFSNVDEFVNVANKVLNRRKSRAGRSLEHHLAAIFDGNNITYSSQAVTEGNKKPDFLFPSKEAYYDIHFPTEALVTLAAKTTCKDRWRQILNEADRLKGAPKYLCTLQQGISGAQMDEMMVENVILVVPDPYISLYPSDRQSRIWSIARFVRYIKELEGK